jgi:hypothetical protein
LVGVTLYPSRASAQVAPLSEQDALKAGDRATASKQWADARGAYQQALAKTRSERAIFGLAGTHYELGELGVAYELYEEYVNTFGVKAPAARRTLATKRLTELAQKTGLLTINVNVTGAEIAIDDASVGVSPLSKPLRLTAGPHRVKISKAGMSPWSRVPNVQEGGVTTLAAELEAQSSQGRVVIKETSGKPVRVVIDGVDVGPAPWEGDLPAGVHEITVRGVGLNAESQKVEVERGARREFVVTAEGGPATLKIVTADGVGAISIDGAPLGEGTVTQTLAPGEHTIKVTREGYEPFEKKVTLKARESLTETVTLKLVSTVTAGEIEKKRRPLEGIYGAVQLGGSLGLTALGSTAPALCEGSRGLGARGCSAGTPLGGELSGHFGYHWDPVGLEVGLSARYDYTQEKVDFDGVGDPTSNRLAVGIARSETQDIHRVGGAAVIRSRLAIQGDKFRFSVAGGGGFAHRRLFMLREATANDGSGRSDTFGTPGRYYWSPVLSFDLGLTYRLSETFGLRLGANLMVENATLFSRDSVRTNADVNRFMVAQGQQPVPIITPSYSLATGAQIQSGLYLGVEFGP